MYLLVSRLRLGRSWRQMFYVVDRLLSPVLSQLQVVSCSSSSNTIRVETRSRQTIGFFAIELGGSKEDPFGVTLLSRSHC